MKGIPLRIAIGPRDMENQTVELARRDNLSKSTVSQLDLPNLLLETLNLIQNDLFTRSSLFLKENTFSANSIDQMIEILDADFGGNSDYYLTPGEIKRTIDVTDSFPFSVVKYCLKIVNINE